MWSGGATAKEAAGKAAKQGAPRLIQRRGVRVALATALTDTTVGAPLGDFNANERLAAEKAIIHDKVLVLDPMDPERCLVAFGSHNLGYKASYSNDENLVIVRGHQALAQAYAAHVLDVYDHYRFRAAEAEASASASKKDQWSGFLDPTPAWQQKSSHRLANYLAPPVQ
jgi:phosphatidylserine/phosphatidylglycerophosphate/cardiolipin synthase-like enzyme